MKKTPLYMILTGYLLLGGCAHKTIFDKAVVSQTDLKPSGNSEEWYKEIKTKWTVVLGSQGRRTGPPMMMPSFSGDRKMARTGPIPVTVTATLMDNQVIEAGLQYYQDMIKMSPEEVNRFRQDYWERYQPDKYILIEASLYTTATEDYLELSRWTIFLEDDQENQNSPVRIVETPLYTDRNISMMNDIAINRPFFMDFSNHRKHVFLYFPRIDYYGNPIITDDIKFLKLVFLLDVGGPGRAEGIWIFDSEE